MAPFCVFALLLDLSAASALNFSTINVWNDENKFGDFYKTSKVEPKYIALYKEKLFLSLYKHEPNISSTLAWLDINATAKPPQLKPFPSPVQSASDCSAVQSARGIAVDSSGRLWALDNGETTCPPKLSIFNLNSNNKIVHVHNFADPVVNHTSGGRWLLDLVLDQSNDDCLMKNQSWRVEIGSKLVSALALSPMGMREFLYIMEYGFKEIFSLSVSDLRSEKEKVTLTSIGNMSATCEKMAMDEQGIFYFNIPSNHSVAKWNTKSSFKEEQVYSVMGVENKSTPCASANRLLRVEIG
ncbi:major royal jelly protein 1-like [Cloeon dipterum]|uniref:major royal jelly protein 1-like n=1 Tax=Cloeon dipterum TaxID=197152 RepID=UPI0032203639